MIGYVDSNFTGNIDARKYGTGFVFTLYGTAVSWKATLQSVVTLSIIEAAFITVTMAMKKALWLQGMFQELEINQGKVKVHCDN